MKIYFTFILLFLFLLQKTNAQDTILKMKGDTLIVKIMEIQPTLIKYKKHDVLDSLMVTISKKEIKQILFASGLKQNFNTSPVTTADAKVTAPVDNKIYEYERKYRYHTNSIKETDMKDVLLETKDEKIMSLVRSSNKVKPFQFVGIAAIPFTVYALSYISKSESYNSSSNNGTTPPQKTNAQLTATAFFAAAIVSIGVSYTFMEKRFKYNSQAIALYNKR